MLEESSNKISKNKKKKNCEELKKKMKIHKINLKLNLPKMVYILMMKGQNDLEISMKDY